MKAAGKFPNGQVPVWTTDDGKMLNQSQAILGMLAAKHGYLNETTPMAVYAAQWIKGTLDDLLNNRENTGVFFQDGELPQETIDKVTAAFKHTLDLVEGFMAAPEHAGHPYLCGDKMTVTDIGVFSMVTCMIFNDHLKSKALGESLRGAVKGHPKLAEWYGKMKAEFGDYLAARAPSPM